ncbi:MAG: degT [Paenibacillaceae bacterium]|nr:degT [Paenibacillaceae bacterium]
MDQVKNRVTPKTKAIIPVHLYGRMVDLRSFVGWAAERRIAVVEDCAQAAGARAYGRRAGSWGVMGCHSFYPDKNLGALGDGGAITTSSPELCGKLRKLRNHGGEIRYQHELPGYNSRLDPIQACALELKLARLDSWNEHRRRAASRYQMRLGDLQGIVLPAAVSPDDESHVFHLYVIRVMDGRRDELKKHLQKKGILTAIQYPAPVHLLPAYAYLEHGREAFPLSEQYAGEILSLPMHAVLTEQEIDLISGEIRALLQA